MTPSTATSSTSPVWADVQLPRFSALDRELEVDVVVVGGGLTGLTTAYLLRKAGARVALIERERLASVDTCRTTAHLTYVTDTRLSQLVSKFGQDAARSIWEGGAAAIDQIWQLVEETGAECEFAWVSGYLHAPLHSVADADRDNLAEDARLARELGFDATFMDSVPQVAQCGVHFAQQAKFHPLKYLATLAQRLASDGALIFEDTAFDEFDAKAGRVQVGNYSIRCDRIVIATHDPLMGGRSALSATLFQTKLSLYTSYVLGARLPAGTSPQALFWDTGDPYDYLRIDDRGDHQYAIFGGEDVKTGQERDAAEVFRALEVRLKRRLPMANVERRWMGQVIETADGIPYIGESSERQFIATGFCGNGFTLGTLGAMMARDWYLNRPNPWTDLLRVERPPFHGGLWRYVSENLDYPYYLLRGRLAPADKGSPEELKNGEAKVLQWRGQKVAAYRGDDGALSVCSAVCTHLKCVVRWNDAAKTWDCPCHGSRFHSDGRVLSGPAEQPLERIDPQIG